MDTKYTAEATAWGGREGRVATSDGIVDMQLALPTGLGGPGGAANPELLFAAGYAACFHSALKVVAREAGVDVSESAVTARVSIGVPDDGGFQLAVELEGELPGVDEDTAGELLAKAHTVCPYSKATRGNIEVSLHTV